MGGVWLQRRDTGCLVSGDDWDVGADRERSCGGGVRRIDEASAGAMVLQRPHLFTREQHSEALRPTLPLSFQPGSLGGLVWATQGFCFAR